MSKLFRIWLAMMLVAVANGETANAQNPFITVQSTTSTENSGLFAYLLPIFTKETGIDVHVVAVGTGQAIKNAQRGDGDVLLVHSRTDEEKFVADGYGVKRYDVMYNDFVVLAPSADPAGISGGRNAKEAFRTIANSKSKFVSRGDDSGTHKAEIKLWQAVGVDVKSASGSWYVETGQGMGPTLNMASSLNAYVLSDRASWSAFNNKGELKLAVEGDPQLYNPYGVILVNPERNKNVKAKEGQAFIDWLTSAAGQAAISAFKINGEQQFFPNAAK